MPRDPDLEEEDRLHGKKLPWNMSGILMAIAAIYLATAGLWIWAAMAGVASLAAFFGQSRIR